MTAPKHDISDRSVSLSKAWKERLDFTDGLAGTSFHNTWRAIKFSVKGKRAGSDDRWKKFKSFIEDMYPTYSEGLRLSRNDKTKPFSKNNCIWISPDSLGEFRLRRMVYNNETKTLKEWCLQYDVNYNGACKRYMTGKNYTPHEILFGKDIKRRRALLDGATLEIKQLRLKASKMLSQYRTRDKRRGFQEHRISIEWFIENILYKSCAYCGCDKYIGAERLENHKPHSIENIIPACYRCNSIRGDKFTFEEMKKIGSFLKDNIDPPRKLRTILPSDFVLVIREAEEKE